MLVKAIDIITLPKPNCPLKPKKRYKITFCCEIVPNHFNGAVINKINAKNGINIG